MADTMQFDLVAPERKLASLEATSVQIPAMDGDMTALPNHAPFLTTLRPGILRVVSGSETTRIPGHRRFRRNLRDLGDDPRRTGGAARRSLGRDAGGPLGRGGKIGGRGARGNPHRREPAPARRRPPEVRPRSLNAGFRPSRRSAIGAARLARRQSLRLRQRSASDLALGWADPPRIDQVRGVATGQRPPHALRCPGLDPGPRVRSAATRKSRQ